ncbi:MAG: NAD(P)-binding protein [Polyangiaceae bacterium]|nr:NAD(P)-binding protein [Polyangiaceae bacterium]
MAKTPLFSALRRSLQRALGKTPGEGPDAATLAKRRAFLQASLGAAGLGAMPALTGCDDEEVGEETIVIVGGGMAGIHCAYQLKEAGITSTVYEASKRIGGRMFSSTGSFPQAPGQLCELGGELIDTEHTTLHELAKQLGLVLDDRAAEPAGIETETYWLNGVKIDNAVIQQQFNAVAPTFQTALTAADDENDSTAYDTLDATTLDQWLKDNVPIAMYPELHGVLQVAYRGEYGLENTEQSALNLIYLIGSDEPDPFRIFGSSDERFHTHLGNESFPRMLSEQLDPGQIELEHKLLAVRDADGGFELDFETPSGPETVSATRIVFALPFTMLREVDLSGLTISEDKRTMIAELGYGTNAKVMAGFSTRTWRNATNSANGSLTTDFNVQQTWETTIGQEGDHGIITNFLGGQQGLASANGTEAEWIQGVLPDLETVWPGTQAAFTGTAVRMHWPTVPTMKGSYACYKPGQWQFFGLEGEREGNLHFCGEHTSLDFQGYMEGAAETGAFVAAEIIDEQGGTKPQSLVAALGVKLLFPQAVYRAGRYGRLSPFARRRLKRDIMRRLAAEADAAE